MTTIQLIPIAGTRLATLDLGQGPPLLFVHGFPLDHTMWSEQWSALSREFRLIVPDLRGFGSSPLAEPPATDPECVTMAQYADDLAQLLDSLNVHEPVTYCGLSMGGYIGWEMMRRHPERLSKAILADTRAIADTLEMARGRELMAQRVLLDGPAPLVDSMFPKLFAPQTWESQHPIVLAARQIALRNSPLGIAAALRGMAYRQDMTTLLPTLQYPIQLLCGEFDAISTVAEMQEIATALPHAQLNVISAAGHLAPWENPIATNAVMRKFLQADGCRE